MAVNGSAAGDVCQQDAEPTTLLFLPLILSILWVLLDLFYSPALLGWALTRVAAFFLTDCAISLGSIQVSLLTGRVLFKDIHYSCRDFSIRLTDGYVAFRWWKRAGGGCRTWCNESMEKRTALVVFQLNGFQLHWYNRSDVYDNWGSVEPPEAPSGTDTHDSLVWSLWKELRPSLHFNINKGRAVFGNWLLERSLTVYCQRAEAHYKTTKASNAYDELMHVVKLWLSEVKAVLEPSTGPPVTSDNVDTLLRSDTATITYSWDSLGLVPLGDTPDPLFSWDIELGSNSVINYGSYANHQRHSLQTFFFPNDYTERPASYIPQAGERRLYSSMDITVRLSSQGSFNIPFRDEKQQLHQIGLSLGEGSEVKVHQPWITGENGYTSVVMGVLQDVVITSDLSYPHLASATTLQLNMNLDFPRVWNSTQRWDMQLMANKVEISVLFSYIDFVNALIDDWIGKDAADLLHFVPVDWTITLSLSEYEIYMYTSRYNWLDKDCLENAQLAFCGTTGLVKLHFPFTVFNPLEQRVTFTANGQDVVVRHHLPPSLSAREAVLALSAANKHRWRVLPTEQPQIPRSSEADNKETFPMGYRGHTLLEDGWVDLACGPSISLTIDYVGHTHHANLFLPNSMHIDISAPSVLLRVFGFLTTDLLALKENYPGEYIEFSTYNSTSPAEPLMPVVPQPPLTEVPPAMPPFGVPDVPQERFLDITVDFSLHNITAEFPTFSSHGQPMDACLPSVSTSELAVHVDYTASDTKVFLHVSPFTVLIPSWPSRGQELGHILGGGLQLNCHGLTEMLCGERVEYAWLMQLELHRISVALTTLQLTEASGWLQATVQQVVGVADARADAPNRRPIRPLVEPLSEDIKYTLFDLSVAEIDIHIMEEDHLLKLQSPGLDMGLCGLHADSETLGLSLQLHALSCLMCTPMTKDLHRLMEAGRVEVGRVQTDIALRKPKSCVPERQRAFLTKADMASRRLWFLWSPKAAGLGCGCCGGCQFLDSSITRRPPRPSATVFTADHLSPALKRGTVSRDLGLHALKKSLQTVCISDMACPQVIHTGLQGYYDRLYQLDSSPSHPCTGSDTESFVSARASPDPSSESDTNEFYSLENVNEAGLEGHNLPGWRKPRSKVEECRNEPETDTVLEDLPSFLPSYNYQIIPLYVLSKGPGQRPLHQRRHSASYFIASKGSSHVRTLSDVPLATPPRTPSSAHHSTRHNSMLLRLPLLVPERQGTLPPLLVPDRQGTLPSLNIDMTPEKDHRDCSQSTDEHEPQFTVSVNISVCESLSITLSPPITDLLTSMTKSLTAHFQQRGALAVLTGCSLETVLSLNSHLDKFLDQSHDTEPFSVHISLDTSCVAVRLVQPLPQRCQLSTDPLAQCSLATATVFGLQVNSLVQTQTQRVVEDDSTVSSLQLSLQGNCPSLYLSLAVQQSTQPSSSLPNLLTNANRLERVVSPSPGLCSLLEVGCVSPSFTVAAKIVTLEVSHHAVLTWEHVQSHSVDECGQRTSQQREEVNNKLAVSVVLPRVWADIAAPHAGRPSPSTGGLDLIVGADVCVTWQRSLRDVVECVQELLETKQARDRRILLALLTNAARAQLKNKTGCPLLTTVAAAVRQAVAFHCLHQMWIFLPSFSDRQLTSIPASHSCHEELLAAALSLATRFYSEDSCSERVKNIPGSPPAIDPTTCPPCGPYRFHRSAEVATDSSSHSSGGYIRGVSPSPSELALPNVAFSNQQLDQVDMCTFEELYQTVSFGEVIVVRESLLPLLKAVSIPTAPQLRALCHNQQKLQVDCSLQLREGTMFVLEPFSSPTLPVLNLKQAEMKGHSQARWDSIAHPSGPSVLCTAGTTSNHSTKRRVNGHFSAQAGIISVGITEPLMKLCRHLVETSTLLSQSQSSLKPTARRTPPYDETDGPAPLTQSSALWQFSQQLISQLNTLQRGAFNRQQDIPSHISLSRPSSAGSVHSRSVRTVIADYSHSPNNIVGTPSDRLSHHLSPPTVTHVSNNDSSSSEVAIQMEQLDAATLTSPASQSPMDTSGGDLPSSDDMQLSSESHKTPSSSLPAAATTLDASQTTEWLVDTIPLQRILQTPPTLLTHSIFGLLRLDSLSFTLQVETSTTSLHLAGITGSVDSRQLAAGSGHCVPTYLSVVATIKTTQLGVSDRNLTDSELVRLNAQPIYCSVGLSNSRLLPIATYRCLVKVQGCKLAVRQPPVLVHKRVQQLLPAFSRIYQDVFSPVPEPAIPTTPQQQASNIAAMEMPSRLPQGYTHFSIAQVELLMTPLPSLSITYTVQPVVAHVETTQKIHYRLSIGNHTLRFSPREHQVTLRRLVLPTVTLSGDVRRCQASRLPLVCMKLTVQRVNIDLTTDSLNQLLVLQNSFIKEVNELVQLFINIGESLPQQHWQQGGRQRGDHPGHREDHPVLERRDSDYGGPGVELLSLLDSCDLSIDEICVTVSTPLCTALRFSTSRIDMHITNSGSGPPIADMPVTRSQLLLSGRVEINVNLALGYLQDSSSEDDDFCELAYFRTKISIRNTQQNAPRLSIVGGASKDEAGQPLDTFFISIICPHLYIQSSAVEQAILFWLNCKSVYSYWQHQRKLLNEEVQEATEMFVAQAQRATNLQGPSLDFSKPRLVQISVTDVGACMPMASMFHTPQSSQKSFPALVLTIKEMLLVVNLSRKVASSGSLSGFCLRFANQFTLRQRTWTMDAKKSKIINCGLVNQGTFRLCVATKKCCSETNPSVVLGEKLVWAFQWDMSGIDVSANSDIGHHMSTLVRTATTIGTSLEGQHPTHLAPRTGPATPPSKVPRKLHKRAFSEAGPVRREPKRDYVEEGMTNLAKGTIQVSKLQSLGASRDSLKREIEVLKETEHQLRKKVGRLFRRRRGFSIQRITEFFSPTNANKMERGGGVRRRWTLKNPRRLFSSGDPQPSIPEEVTGDRTELPLQQRSQTASTVLHSQTVSNVTAQYPLHGDDDSSSSGLTPSVTPVPGEEGGLQSPFPPTPITSTPAPHSAFSFQQSQHQPAPGLMASIDVEVNVTVNIESGIVKLHCKDDSVPERQTSSPTLLTSTHHRLAHSHLFTPPLQPRRLQARTKDSGNDTVIILIPALNVQVHYKSIVGQSYQFPSPTSSLHLPTPTTSTTPPPSLEQVPRVKITPGTPSSATLPMKRGVLSISVVVASTPEDVTLTPSLLEFVEQVVRPAMAATINTETDSSSDTDSGEDSEEEEKQEIEHNTDTPAISFPIDVTIVFQMQPSTVCLSCQPHSRVNCIVCSPKVNFVVSFSLFSPRETEGDLPSPGPPSVVTFNNLYVTGCLKTFTLQLLSPQVPTLKQKEPDAGKKMETKEALSLTLGQALTHLSRKSVLTIPSITSSVSSMDESCTQSKLQVSVVTNIASLVLGYDMRRLNDLTTFRRYWYRTSLIESFIGSKKPHQSGGEQEEADDAVDSGADSSVSLEDSISAAIVVAATVEDFRISANVAQVMGNTNLVVTHLQCQTHADISRNELVLLRLTGGMERGEIDARGGMVAGSVLMQDVGAQVTTESHCGLIPVHTARMSLTMAEARVDYMSSCILLGRASQLVVTGRDSWKGLQLAGLEGNRAEANIQVLVELSWDQVQLAIHRTTTKSLMNIVQKIHDFILQQKRRSERTISIMLPADTRVSKALAAYREKEKQADQNKGTELFHNHWLWATRFGSLELMRAVGVPARSDQHLVSLGGEITLAGQNLCLVCFHGTSFRDHEWAVFNIDHLSASFLTQAIPSMGTEAKTATRACHQVCRLQLGEQDCKLTELATVHRVSAGRGRVPPITGTNINNWLAYACIDCHLHKLNYEDPTTQAQQTVLKLSKRLNIQQVLLVPGVSVKLINDHFSSAGSSQQHLLPLVECSLFSKFSAGISVSTNVDHYLFLHALVKSYIEYLERHKVPLRETEVGEDVDKPATVSPRHFKCVWWELEPRLNLLSSVSGEFNPHINWLLETLGFKHARTTIPKWVQRGVMDPLDNAVAVAVEILVQFSAKKKL